MDEPSPDNKWMHEPSPDNKCYTLLREMELAESKISESDGELDSEMYEEQAGDSMNTVLVLEQQHPKAPTWGPVISTRRSTRVDIGGRTMLEIAMDSKAVQNLEKNKASVKGTIIKNSFNHFHDPKFIKIANQIGVEIENAHPNVDRCISIATSNADSNTVNTDTHSINLSPGKSVLSSSIAADTACHPSSFNAYPSSFADVPSSVNLSPAYMSTDKHRAAANAEHSSCVDRNVDS